MWELLLLVCEQCCSVSEWKLLPFSQRSENQPINIVSSTKSVITAEQKFPDCSTRVITHPNHIYDNSFFLKVYIYVCTQCSLTCSGSSEKQITNTSLNSNILSFGCTTNARNKHSNGVSSFWLHRISIKFLFFSIQNESKSRIPSLTCYSQPLLYTVCYIL